MQIKTAVTLTFGAAVGFLFGCFVTDDVREKAVSKVKDRIVYALTGEHTQKKRYSGYKPVTYTQKKEQVRPNFNWNCLKKDLFEFDSFEEADEMVGLMTKNVQNYGYLSLHEAAYMRNMQPMDYTWDKYGWTEEDVKQAEIIGIGGKWEILMSFPRILKKERRNAYGYAERI